MPWTMPRIAILTFGGSFADAMTARMPLARRPRSSPVGLT
jgi:hypothetical protein